jgi:hypothetical protein
MSVPFSVAVAAPVAALFLSLSFSRLLSLSLSTPSYCPGPISNLFAATCCASLFSPPSGIGTIQYTMDASLPPRPRLLVECTIVYLLPFTTSSDEWVARAGHISAARTCAGDATCTISFPSAAHTRTRSSPTKRLRSDGRRFLYRIIHGCPSRSVPISHSSFPCAPVSCCCASPLFLSVLVSDFAADTARVIEPARSRSPSSSISIRVASSSAVF